jgi:hypothetical protein
MYIHIKIRAILSATISNLCTTSVIMFKEAVKKKMNICGNNAVADF